jgi:anionic cell wall polymer biosynthesis LytR-Cps2A-Psr (LCP) family protein
MEAVRSNFGVDVHHYVRIQFPGLREFVDALGGVEIDLTTGTAGLPAGRHLLNGEQALAFIRSREGADDFTRMGSAQSFVRALMLQFLRPAAWPRLPIAALALLRAVDTDLPPWIWPRMALAMIRLGPGGIDFRSITREMVQPFTTAGGASVLAPDWGRINPVLLEMFGQ